MILSCSATENLKRLVSPERKTTTKTKLVDREVLVMIRDSEKIETLGDVDGLAGEIQIETSTRGPEETAAVIARYCGRVMDEYSHASMIPA